MFCSKCGNEIKDNSSYCEYCGHKRIAFDLENKIIEETENTLHRNILEEDEYIEQYRPEKERTKSKIVVFGLLIGILALIIAIGCLGFFNNGLSKQDVISIIPSDMTQIQVNQETEQLQINELNITKKTHSDNADTIWIRFDMSNENYKSNASGYITVKQDNNNWTLDEWGIDKIETQALQAPPQHIVENTIKKYYFDTYEFISDEYDQKTQNARYNYNVTYNSANLSYDGTIGLYFAFVSNTDNGGTWEHTVNYNDKFNLDIEKTWANDNITANNDATEQESYSVEMTLSDIAPLKPLHGNLRCKYIIYKSNQGALSKYESEFQDVMFDMEIPLDEYSAPICTFYVEGQSDTHKVEISDETATFVIDENLDITLIKDYELEIDEEDILNPIKMKGTNTNPGWVKENNTKMPMLSDSEICSIITQDDWKLCDIIQKGNTVEHLLPNETGFYSTTATFDDVFIEFSKDYTYVYHLGDIACKGWYEIKNNTVEIYDLTFGLTEEEKAKKVKILQYGECTFENGEKSISLSRYGNDTSEYFIPASFVHKVIMPQPINSNKTIDSTPIEIEENLKEQTNKPRQVETFIESVIIAETNTLNTILMQKEWNLFDAIKNQNGKHIHEIKKKKYRKEIPESITITFNDDTFLYVTPEYTYSGLYKTEGNIITLFPNEADEINLLYGKCKMNDGTETECLSCLLNDRWTEYFVPIV